MSWELSKTSFKSHFYSTTSIIRISVQKFLEPFFSEIQAQVERNSFDSHEKQVEIQASLLLPAEFDQFDFGTFRWVESGEF